MVLCWRSPSILIYWEWHLILSWLLRSIFAWCPEQLLKDLVSWGSPGKYSMIDCSSADAFGVLSCQFWNIVLQCGVWLLIHILNPLWKKLTSNEYISVFLISILNIYIWNLNIYFAIGVIFKEMHTNSNCQPEKITQVKRTNAPFFVILQVKTLIAIAYRPEKKYANNIKCTLDF